MRVSHQHLVCLRSVEFSILVLLIDWLILHFKTDNFNWAFAVRTVHGLFFFPLMNQTGSPLDSSDGTAGIHLCIIVGSVVHHYFLRGLGSLVWLFQESKLYAKLFAETVSVSTALVDASSLHLFGDHGVGFQHGLYHWFHGNGRSLRRLAGR